MGARHKTQRGEAARVRVAAHAAHVTRCPHGRNTISFGLSRQTTQAVVWVRKEEVKRIESKEKRKGGS